MAGSGQAWVKAGAFLSLGTLAFAFLRGHRVLGRLSAGFAGAFLESWRDARLEKKVSRILARVGSVADAKDSLGRIWGNP